VRAPVCAERRYRRRSTLRLDLRCTLAGSGEVLTGATCDISTFGVRFRIGRRLARGERVQLSLTWPNLREARHPLQLVV